MKSSRGGSSGLGLDKFMELVRNTEHKQLLALVHQYVPPMCPTEISTKVNLKSFMETVLQNQTPILSALPSDQQPQQLSDSTTNELKFLQKLVCVIGHITKLVKWKRAFGELVRLTDCGHIIPCLSIHDPQWTEPITDLKLEAYSTFAKLLEMYESQAGRFLSKILPFLETHFQAVLDGKTSKNKEASDLLAAMVQINSKVFTASSLTSMLRVSIVIFFASETAESKLEQLNVIGHITKKLLHLTKSPSNTTTPSAQSQQLESTIENFPSDEILRVANHISREIMPHPDNMVFWFEDCVLALALFCGITAQVGDLQIHATILELSLDIYSEQLKNIQHSSKEERQYNIFLVQAITQAINFSNKTTLQPRLLSFYSELRKLNLSSKKAPQESKQVKQYFQKLRSLIIRAVAATIKAINDFTPFADQFLRETAKELADPTILADFVEALGDSANQYLNRVLKPLFIQLEKETVSQKVKQVIIETLNRIIKHTTTQFLPYLQECAQVLRPLASFALVTDSCIPLVSLYSTILVTFCEYSQIDEYIPVLLSTFLDILKQEIAMQTTQDDDVKSPEEETNKMDLSPFSICEVLSNLRVIFCNQLLTSKILQIAPTFLPEVIVYLMDHIPTPVICVEDSFIRVAQLEFIQQADEETISSLKPLIDLILQNIELNTNEIDVQVASFDTLEKFTTLQAVRNDKPQCTKIKTMCEGSMFLAREQHELNSSIQRVMTSLTVGDKA